VGGQSISQMTKRDMGVERCGGGVEWKVWSFWSQFGHNFGHYLVEHNAVSVKTPKVHHKHTHARQRHIETPLVHLYNTSKHRF
jgi:hypothetical protein